MQPKKWWQKSFSSFLLVVAFGFFILGGLTSTAQQIFHSLGWIAGAIFQSAFLFFVLSFYFSCVESLVLRRFTVEFYLSSVMTLLTATVTIAMCGIVM